MKKKILKLLMGTQLIAGNAHIASKGVNTLIISGIIKKFSLGLMMLMLVTFNLFGQIIPGSSKQAPTTEPTVIQQQTPPGLKPQEITGKEKEKIVEGLLRDKDFLKACDIIAHDNEEIDPKNPSVYRVGKSLQIKWKITSSARTNNVSFSFLIADLEGNKPFVYFDEKNERYTAPVKSTTTTAKLKWPPSWWPGGGGGSGGGSGAGSGFCWNNWSGWATIGEKCDYAGGCIFKGQRAKFIQEKRYCFTNPSNVQTRWKKLHCGC